MQSRIAIVNRSEPARRLIHAARELNHERGWRITTIALHTEDERRATFVREADEAVLIGTPGGGNPYLDHAELERALRTGRADAVWVGWGFVAEDAAFVELCDRLGVTFVGPPADVMRALGDKIAAKQLAERVGVPVAAWSGGPVETTEEAVRHAGEIGYPLMIKAAAGGGGRGIRIVRSEEELLPALARAREEGRRSFGDATVLMERLVEGARHVEVQVIGDHHGNGWALGVRDCSVQRRSQKLIEESSSPALTREQDRALRQSALDLVLAAGYRNAGTVEFLYQPEDRAFAFLEVNTRLQVEHPVTEMATGVDLVKLQLHVAFGGRLEGDPPDERGHAIEARLNAEDPDRGFAPTPGTVELMSLPTGPGIRVDTGIGEGDRIPPEYDSMIAKVIAWGADRDEARARLRRALEEMAVVVRGGATNRSFLIELLGRPEVVGGTAHTAWLDGPVLTELSSGRNADVAIVAAAIESADAAEAVEREQFYASARRGRPKASHQVARQVELRHRGEAYRLSVARTGPQAYRVTVPEGTLDVAVERLGRFASRLQVDGRTHRVTSVFSAPDHLVEVDGAAHRVSLDEGGLIRAPAPALVVALAVAPGDEVEAGAPVVVLESMKMETTVTAPFTGVVAEVLTAGNVQVDAGAPLVRIEAVSAGSEDGAGGSRVSFEPPAEAGTAGPYERATRALADIRSLLLGYDVSEREARRLVDELQRLRAELSPGDPARLGAELDALRVFADLAELSRDRPPPEGEEAEVVHSPREHFRQFLRSLDADREGLPEPVKRSLARALAHYGISDMARSRELAEAAYRIFLAEERSASRLPVVAALLDGPLRDASTLPDDLRDELRGTLDRLVAATQLRHPAIGERARSVRYAAFDGPLIAAAREEVYRRARAQLDALAGRAGEADYQERIEAVVASPQPLVPLLGERLAGGVPDHEPMLEILTRRFYKIRTLRDVSLLERGGRQLVTAVYDRENRQVRLVTTLADPSDIEGAVAAAADVVRESDCDRAVVDLYMAWPDAPEPDAMAAEVARHLGAVALPSSLARIAVSVAGAGERDEHHFTFRPGEGGFEEERVVRDLHPMIARRLRLWRLANFDLTRLPSVEDTYLFHCVARDAPADERFVALAEVRDLTPVRRNGTLISLPEVEHKLAGCLEGIRRAQARRPERRRLHANHVFLHVWPTVDIPLRELTVLTRRLAPITEGLGLEEVLLSFTAANGEEGPHETALRFSHQPGAGVTVAQTDVPTEPLMPLDDYAQRVLAARRRGTVYPYELVRLLAGPEGTFVEHALDAEGRLVPVDRPPGGNTAGIVTGLVHTPTEKHPEGVVRVAVLGDPTRSLGSVAEGECRRIMAAIDLAEEKGVPVE